MAVILPDGTSYVPTSTDRTWLMRAVEREGEPRRLVAQTLVNRFSWLHSRGHYPTLESFVRAYAQPVNPRWYPAGDLHQAAVNKVRNRTDIPAINKTELIQELERRATNRRDVFAVSSHFAPAVIEAVDQALERGPLNIGPGTVHYAAARIRRAWPVTHEPASSKENRFYRERDGRSGTFLYSVVDPGSPPARARGGLAAVVVGFFLALFAIARGRRV